MYLPPGQELNDSYKRKVADNWQLFESKWLKKGVKQNRRGCPASPAKEEKREFHLKDFNIYKLTCIIAQKRGGSAGKNRKINVFLIIFSIHFTKLPGKRRNLLK